MDNNNERPKFATRFGVIAATVGSAVGLGNIWRFPYEAGAHGGGTFLIANILCVLLIGIPVVCAEFMIGRAGRLDICGSMRKLAPRHPRAWQVVGFLGVLCALLIIAFYAVVSGWTLEYLFQSVTGQIDSVAGENRHAVFDSFTSGWRCVFWTVVIVLLTGGIVLRGVEKGIERASNLMMPLLFVLLIAMVVNSLLLPGAGEGLKFLFFPDFSQLNGATLLSALGQAFFSLSVGLGTLTVYGSYFPAETRIIKSASIMAFLDTMVAIMAGVIIFPAVFSFGMEPAAGPKLVFEVLPDIFSNLPGGAVWSTVFFLLLLMASLTSIISLSEVGIAFCMEHWRMSRNKSVLVITLYSLAGGILCALSFGPLADMKLFGMTMFNLFDFVTSNFLMPVGGMLISIFAGWMVSRATVKKEFSPAPKFAMRGVVFLLRYVCPLAIFLVMVNNLIPAKTPAQDTNIPEATSLKTEIATLLADKPGQIGVAVIINGPDGGDTVTVNNSGDYPLMSMFKLPQAIAVCHKLDDEGARLDSALTIPRRQLNPDTWSPMLKDFPRGDIRLTVADLIDYILIHSDNNASNLLFDTFASTAETDSLMRTFLTEPDFRIIYTEDQMQRNHDLSYQNRCSPLTYAMLVNLLFTDSIVSPEKQAYILKGMKTCQTGMDRIAAGLPENTSFAHRTGSGYINDRGEIVAVNDGGFVTLPSGLTYSIAVFVKDYPGEQPAAEALIAEVSAVVAKYLNAVD